MAQKLQNVFKVSNILFYSTRKTQKLYQIGAPGDPFGSLKIHSVANYQKIEEGPFGEKKFPKSQRPKKKQKWDPSVSPGTEKVHTRYIPTIVRYAGKEIQPFWFSYFFSTFPSQNNKKMKGRHMKTSKFFVNCCNHMCAVHTWTKVAHDS